MSLLLTCRSLSKSFGARPLFRDISISFDDSERTGLIGPNGSGKSTLLRILAGLEPPDGGEIDARRQLKLAYLPQQDAFPTGLTAREIVAAAMPHSHDDEHEVLVRADVLLGKAGFDRTDAPADALSGGWRKRLAICRELIREPDLLLLDEPTNHLDLEGILWLEKLLSSAAFSFLLVSHDRYFLENVTNRVVELSPAYADGYLSASGTYSDFLVRREEYLAAQARNEQALAGRVRREVEWLRRGAKARTTKAKGRINEAGRMMDDLADLKARNAQGGSVQIDFNATHRQTRKLLTAKSLSKRLGDRELFTGLHLVLAPGTKLGLLGPNGSGKTTLIRVISGELAADTGEIVRAEGLRTVLFDQARRQLDKSATLRRALAPTGDNVVYRDESMHVSGWAKRFLFRTEQLDMPVSALSGGEQARILIARLMLQPADVLILDEPTNDLDIPSLEVLEESLADFPGALVLVTHDRFMLDRVSTEILALDGAGGVRPHASYAEWERARDEALREAAITARAPAKPAAKGEGATPAKKRLTYMELRELEQMEAKILEAEDRLQSLQSQMADPAVMADRHRFTQVCTHVDAAQQQVQGLYERWQELEARK